MNIWPKSRQIHLYMIKSANIFIFSKYVGFLQDLSSTGAKTTLLVDFWWNQILDPINISFYQPDDMLLEAVLVIMGDKDFHLLC